MTRKLVATVFLFILIILAGCSGASFYEYSDEQSLLEYQQKDIDAVKRLINSGSSKSRLLGLRILSELIKDSSDGGQKSSYVDIMLGHFNKESNGNVKSILITVCLRDAGVSDQKVFDFLCVCLNDGDCTEDAVYTLAALFPEKSQPVLFELLNHPSVDLRYSSALAITTIDDQVANKELKNRLLSNKNIKRSNLYSDILKRLD